ncbi:2-hydroxychromene-2-carboxylate isomerase [Aestuariivita sp.]|jgi:2-hydroxychromene-2-carboxylate isomerase|uniref:2-hydroxychromene-2-carboxylate isomerase n=1 Tax=Aestuariivita sp. TaxID=1872407 RepID=UPI00216D5055|nr:2-hydroxychromene-2-carboxylate isomerase [Aestuariivita sp.]MCE8007263.1 2-hydroxychromene-2-carboxylate isomerase [Aestuariivita sp.]
MARALEFWFEFASTYSYPAAMRIQDACAQAAVPLIWRPILLGPIFAAQGISGSPFTLYPAKGANMWRDMERLCADAGLAFRKPGDFPRGSLLAARIAAHHADAPWIGDFVRAVYLANFAEDHDIGQPAVLIDILTGLALDPEPVLEAAQNPDTKAHLRQLTEQAQTKGLFGAPSFTIGDELFWGHDRLDQAVRWAALA